MIIIILWCVELGLCACLLWYNIHYTIMHRCGTQHASKNQILLPFTSRYPRKANTMNSMSEILSVANCFRMAFWPHWTTAGFSLHTADPDGSSNSVSRAQGCSEVPELIPAGSSRVWRGLTSPVHCICTSVQVVQGHTGLHRAQWEQGSSAEARNALSCWKPRKSIRIEQAYNDTCHT